MTAPISVVVPVFNEQEGVGTSLRELREELERLAIAHELVVVDDGSTDRTAEILAGISGLSVVVSPVNRGYGAAVKLGVRAAAHAWILLTDGDASYPPANIAALLAGTSEADLVVGARSLAAIRNPASWNGSKRAAQWLLSRHLGTAIPDLNSGMRLFRSDLALALEPHLRDGFSYSSGLTVAALRAGYRVRFVPIRYVERQGRSKVRPISFTLAFVRSVFTALKTPRGIAHRG